jgi:hypothetical protein
MSSAAREADHGGQFFQADNCLQKLRFRRRAALLVRKRGGSIAAISNYNSRGIVASVGTTTHANWFLRTSDTWTAQLV